MAEQNPFYVPTKSPDNTYEVTGLNEQGARTWVSRPWRKGERAEYCKTVLHRPPMNSEVGENRD